MLRRKRWALTALAAVAVGAAAPPPVPANAAVDRAGQVDSDATSDGHRSTSIVLAPADVAVPAPTAETQVVIGPDNRVPVGPTTTFPASAVVLLTFNGGQCTGFMISERTVATAGHCVHTGGAGGRWQTNVVAYPGHNGTTAPYGGCPAAALFAPQGWTSRSNAPGGDPAYDYGAVRLNCAIGTQTGWFRLGYPTRSVTGSCTRTQGYLTGRPGQWMSDDVIYAENADFFYVGHDFSPGQNGSPVFLRSDPASLTSDPVSLTSDPDDFCPTPPQLVIPCPCPPQPCVCPELTALGILTNDPFSGPGMGYNIVNRITPQVINNFMQWR